MRHLFIVLILLCTGSQAFAQSKVSNNNPKALFDPTPFAFSHATSAQGAHFLSLEMPIHVIANEKIIPNL